MGFRRLREYADLVLFSHTVFSLPFLVIAMLLAGDGLPNVWKAVWIVVAFLGARNAANAVNRIIDRDLDARNERTRTRHIPAGQVTVREATAVALFCFGLLVLAAAMLGPVCVALLPSAGALFLAYTYSKRITFLSHFLLGLASAGAPVGAWIAITGWFSWPALVLGTANMLYVAGFDIIYAIGDVDFDRNEGLYSVPAVFGVPWSLVISAALHAATLLLLGYLYILGNFDLIYGVGLGVIAVLLTAEHLSVRPGHLANLKIASYGINQVVSVVLLVFATADIVFRTVWQGGIP